MKCKICGEEYHHCTACTFDDWEDFYNYEYCSEKCFKESPEYSRIRTLTLCFYKSLTVKQKEDFWELLRNLFYKYDQPNMRYEFLDILDQEEDRDNIKLGSDQ